MLRRLWSRHGCTVGEPATSPEPEWEWVASHAHVASSGSGRHQQLRQALCFRMPGAGQGPAGAFRPAAVEAPHGNPATSWRLSMVTSAHAISCALGAQGVACCTWSMLHERRAKWRQLLRLGSWKR